MAGEGAHLPSRIPGCFIHILGRSRGRSDFLLWGLFCGTQHGRRVVHRKGMRSACTGDLLSSPITLVCENSLIATFSPGQEHFKGRMDPCRKRKIPIENPSSLTSARAFDDASFAHFVLACADPQVFSHRAQWISVGFPSGFDSYRSYPPSLALDQIRGN